MRILTSIRNMSFFVAFILLCGAVALADTPTRGTEGADKPVVVPAAQETASPMASVADPLLDEFHRQRKRYGDDAMQTFLEANTQPRAAKEAVEPSTNDWIYFFVIGALLLVIVVGSLFRRQGKPTELKDLTLTQTGQRQVSAKNETLLPLGIFPSEWFASVDKAKMEQFVTERTTVSVETFFSKLKSDGTPDPVSLATAQETLGRELNNAITSNDAFELFNGGAPFSQKESNFLMMHLNELMPAFKVPQPIVTQGDIRWPVLAAVAAIGAIGGFMGGAGLARWVMGIPAESGMMFGATFGAFGLTAAAIGVANNPTIRKWALATVATAAAADTGIQLLKKIVLPDWLGRDKGYWKRMLLYAGVGVVLVLIKRSEVYNRDHYRKEIEATVEQWIRSTLPMIALLMFRANDAANNPFIPQKVDQDLVQSLLPMAKRVKNSKGDDREFAADELVQEFEAAGYVLGGEPLPSVFAWDAAMSDKYETFGFIPEGKKVTVEIEPVFRDGNIEKKGRVRKFKG